jgi:hypothetical protein
MHIPVDISNANGHFSIDPAAGTNGIVAKGYSNNWIGIEGLYYPGTYPSTGACTVAWCALTFVNSWHNYSTPTYSSGAYTKSADGVVTLKGLVAGGTVGTTIATLPVGYRPAQWEIMSVESNGAWGRVDIDPSGNISSQAGNTAWFSIDSVSFIAEQ